MAVYEDWSTERAAQVIADHRHLEGATMPILHALQETFGFVPDPAVPLIAESLNLSRAEVYGVLTFYHDFRREPPGHHVVKLCAAEACQSMGGKALAAYAEDKLGVGMGETSPDGKVTLEPIYCLGLCACAPSALVDGQLVGRLDAGTIDEMADCFANGKSFGDA
ncbi:formate dehydrogenase subunit gamma [Xanthobacter agilis]|jgi:formate dehydrogenase subunit gamma|uniref:Formate dehydrogenase subunit gamma n=1 Tax=Xanthobacter agilis TaxID=47492 RepID=A0ABU0LC60_XANAG|nr:formate dehydrogenase subunit gamma [Xanthobacter agilis]MDQ0504727.1 formate dehydrogenase subunit gamma [Xanthobacter agilis]